MKETYVSCSTMGCLLNTLFSLGKYVWRINLFKSEPYWKGWFENLSKLFLGAPTNGRLLLLAGIDRLDKDLTIGQMQGTLFVFYLLFFLIMNH